MRLTNKHNLPEIFTNMLRRDPYTRGNADISVTELISPPRINILRRKFDGEIEVDVSENIWMLMGRAVHTVLEHGAPEEYTPEKRLYRKEQVTGMTISGGVDVQVIEDTITIDDYKFVSVFSAQQEKPEWEAQLNLYRWLAEGDTGKKVTRLRIVAILRDWVKSRIKSDPNYPPSPVMMIEFPLWDDGQLEQYIIQRCSLHKLSREHNILPLCTSKERWERPAEWAVMKDGNKRASAVFSTRQDADKYADKSKAYRVEHRPGMPIRCEGNWCMVSQWCDQWKAYGKGEDRTSGKDRQHDVGRSDPQDQRGDPEDIQRGEE